MSDILKYKFYLNFKNEGSFGRIEITEPQGFDGASFVVEQEAKRYGRDAYKINEEINLEFRKGFFDPSEQRQLPNGTVINNLTMGFEELIDCYNRFSFESDVDFEIEVSNTVFIPSNLDFQTSETDGLTYFSCKAVQTQDKQLIKRRSDVVTNVFSTEDLDGNEVNPIITENILLKAKPITQNSEWKLPNEKTVFQRLLSGGSARQYYNFANSVIKSNILDTLSYIAEPTGTVEGVNNFVYLRASDNLSDVELELDLSLVFGRDTPDITSARISLIVVVTEQDLEPDEFGFLDTSNALFSENVFIESIDNTSPDLDIIDNYTVNIPSIPRDYKLLIFFENRIASLGGGATFVTLNKLDINASGTSTAIDTVVKGCRYIDVIKANLQRVNGYGVFAPRFDVGGQYYDQFLLTGNLIKQRDDLAFNVKFKDLMEDLMEVNSDYQITDNLYIGQYKDFYANKEIAVFVSSPDTSFKSTFNDRYAINEFKYSYKTFEQDRDEENTTDAIHTESEWLTSNKQVENTKEIKVNHIRDAFKIEAIRKLAAKETTSTSDDDKLIALDTTTLAPNSKGGFSARMTHNIDEDGNVQLLKDANLPSWALLGFGVGSNFEILSDDNTGTYTVLEIENTVITLTPISPNTQTFTGESFTKVEYPYTNVLYTNRTNQGLEFSDNLLNADNYSNLRYSIKRNIETWKPYLATASISHDGTFRNTLFKDNGEAITRFEGETNNIQEDTDILNTDLGDGFLTPVMYETRLLAPFSDMSSVLDAIDMVNEDNSIGGFIRCIDNNGKVIKLYPSKLDYVPSTETLTLTGEERNEGKGVDITINGSTVTINEVGYDLDVLSEPFYEFDGDYFKIYDKDKLPIINPTKYTDITVNGLTFDSSSELLGYLSN